MPGVNLGNIAATTLQKHEKSLADAITNHNALLYILEKKGNIKNATGRQIVEPVIYAENGTAKFYDGYETFTVSDTEVVDASVWDWKQLGGFFTLSGLEEVKNSGREAVINLFEAKRKALIATLKNAAATSLYSDGTGTTGKEFGGLGLIVSDDPTAAGTVGGIDQAANAFWRNQIDDHTADASATTAAEFVGHMNSMWRSLVRGADKADLIMMGDYAYNLYETYLQDKQRVTSSKMADAGFESLRYKGADVVYDDACPTKKAYFLDTNHLCMRKSEGRWFNVGEQRVIDNADYKSIPVFVAGNLTTSNRSRHGLLIAK